MTSKMDHGGSNAVRALLLLVVSALMPHSAFAAEQLGIELDQATIMKLPEKVSTIVIGNPLIADVAVQSGGLVVVTGKGYGTTNLIVLDRNGSVLMERSVVVRGASQNTVAVFRGVERETYSCTPLCERRITLGDSGAYFSAVIGQTDIRNSQSSGAAAKK
jgi:Flp pilus assembly secretin CpaC